MKTLRGKFGYADHTSIAVTLEGQRELRMIVKPGGRTVYEEGEHAEFKFQPGKPVKLSWECSSQPHTFTLDDNDCIVSIQCDHSTPSPPP
ncbi:hypothetical protein E6H36_12975 [Candidatus Bathyarchaeota archaeon]|nr:MAG: hypothetical protein E6H36_12975 [Candidatus Bathyarchaeota archaeon]TMI32330.1 MAG: hypothetical protein E6H29_02455 [Candidatus Bathyarchaeota archaeon]